LPRASRKQPVAALAQAQARPRKMKISRVRVCKNCGCMEPFQLMSNECCLKNSGNKCEFKDATCDDDDPNDDGDPILVPRQKPKQPTCEPEGDTPGTSSTAPKPQPPPPAPNSNLSQCGTGHAKAARTGNAAAISPSDEGRARHTGMPPAWGANRLLPDKLTTLRGLSALDLAGCLVGPGSRKGKVTNVDWDGLKKLTSRRTAIRNRRSSPDLQTDLCLRPH